MSTPLQVNLGYRSARKPTPLTISLSSSAAAPGARRMPVPAGNIWYGLHEVDGKQREMAVRLSLEDDKLQVPFLLFFITLE